MPVEGVDATALMRYAWRRQRPVESFMYVSQAEFARIRKVTPQRINALVKKGRLPVNARKQIDLEEGIKLLDQDLHPAWESKQLAPAAAASPAMGDEAEGEADATFKSARTRKEELQARSLEIDLAVKQGLYLPKRDVEDAMVTAGRRQRQQLDAITSWADELYALSREADATALRKLLKTKVRALQQTMSDSLSLLADEEEPDHAAAAGA
jgi:hypothetical protein